jgi:hypothetical protein
MISSVCDRAVASRRNVRFNSPFQTSDEDEGDLPALVRRGIMRQSEYERGKWLADLGAEGQALSNESPVDFRIQFE